MRNHAEKKQVEEAVASVVRLPREDADRLRQDELNQRIVAHLEKDGRMPFSEIAQALGVSEGTVRNRVNSLRDAGIMRIVAIAEPIVPEYQADAVLGVKVAAGFTPASVAERLGRHEDVVYILWVAGRFDLFVELVSEDRESLLGFLNDEIHDSGDIAEVEVMFGLRNFKNQFLLKRGWSD
ncbi:MAG: Lrp/AsnC family transcriptional regulator [Rhodospirillales bacterium]